jgi:hypothetical protein
MFGYVTVAYPPSLPWLAVPAPPVLTAFCDPAFVGDPPPPDPPDEGPVVDAFPPPTAVIVVMPVPEIEESVPFVEATVPV